MSYCCKIAIILGASWILPIILYGQAAPTAPTFSSPDSDCNTSLTSGGTTCADCPITLTTTYTGHNSSINYTFEYYGPEHQYYELVYNGPDKEPTREFVTNWKRIYAGNSLSVEFDASTLNQLDSRNTSYRFRVVARGADFTKYSEIVIRKLSPLPPKFEILSTTESCPEIPTGEIEIDVLYKPYIQIEAILDIQGVEGGGGKTTTYDPFTLNELWSDVYLLNLKNSSLGGQCVSETVEVTIGQLPPLEVQIQKEDISCFGSNDGWIELTTSGGQPGREITFTSETEGLDLIRISNTKIRFINLSKGTYNFEVSDAYCNVPIDISETIAEPDPVSADINSLPLNCEASPNGSISISNVKGGFADKANSYKYHLYKEGTLKQSSSSTTSKNYIFNGLTSGNYIVEVELMDGNNCENFSSNVAISNNRLITNYTKIDKSCSYLNDGQININASGGGGNVYTFKISGPVSRVSTTPNFSNLPSGIYTLTVENQNSCTDKVTFTNINIESPNQVSFMNTNISNVICNGGSNGAINLDVSGGTGAYSYQWKRKNGLALSGKTNQDITGLAAGEYYLTVQDGKGCTFDSEVFLISQPPAISVSAEVKQITCFNSNDGKIILTKEGGTGNLQGQYRLSTSSSWTNFVNSKSFAAGTYYIRVVDDNGCIKELGSPIKITAPSLPLSTSTSKSDITCNGLTNGSITVVAANGNGEFFTNKYFYSINGGSFIQDDHQKTYTGLTAGTYSIRVKDERGCLVTGASQTINEPSIVTSSIVSTTNVECFNATTGEIVMSASGGVGSYKYRINSGLYQTSNTFKNLGVGLYKIDVKDGNNCLASQKSVTISQPAEAIKINGVTIEKITCNNGSDGKLTASYSGGNENNLLQWQRYTNGSWANVSGANGTVLNNRSAGTYRLKISNSAGGNCTATSNSIVLENPELLKFDEVIVKQVSCRGAADATINPNVSGGWANYKFYYGKNGSAVSNLFNSSTKLGPGNYQIKVTDNEGCQVLYGNTISITQPSVNLSATATLSDFNGDNISCHNASDGKITISPVGGNGTPFGNTYSYSLNGNAFQSSNEFKSLNAGSYSYTVKDERGCTFSQNIVLSQPEKLEIEVSDKNDDSCFDGGTGFIVSKATGGKAPYSFSINGGSFQTGVKFQNLKAGNYTILVKDANGCISSVTTQISQPASPLLYSSTKEDILCYNDNNGKITVIASGGWGNYSYSWQKKSGSTWNTLSASGIEVTGLASGRYRAIINDAGGCSVTTSEIEIINPQPLEFDNVDIQQIVCKGDANGAITPTASGGWGGFTYKFSKNDGAFQTLTSSMQMEPGIYTIKVEDSRGCEKIYSQSITIHEPTIQLDFTSSLSDYNGFQISCKNGADGKIQINAMGGNGGEFANAYEYKIGETPYSSKYIFESLTAGSYNITIRDQRGCEVSKNVFLNQPSELKSSLAEKNYIKCFGDSSGFIEAGTSGGVFPYSYSIENSDFQNSNRFENLEAGEYNIIVKDANNCEVSFSTSIIQPYDSLTLNFNKQNISCHNGNDGEVHALVGGGNKPYQYDWLDKTADTPSITNLQSGSYFLQVTDREGCMIKDSITLLQPEVPLDFSLASPELNCFGDRNGEITIDATGGTPEYSYSFDNGTTFQSQPFTTDLTAGNYHLIVKDKNNCSTSNSIDVSQPDSLELHLISKSDLLCHNDNSGNLQFTAVGGVGNYQYSLNHSLYGASSDFGNLAAGNYYLQLKDGNGCEVNTEVSLDQPEPLYIAIETSPVICKDENSGKVSIISEGGSGIHKLFLNDQLVDADTLNSLYTGNYSLLLQDSNSCQLDTSFHIIEPTEKFKIHSFNKADVSCYGMLDGFVELDIQGGYGRYLTSINGNSFIDKHAYGNLNAHTYEFVSVDSLGCRDSLIVEIIQPDLLELTISNSQDILCNGDSTGSVILEASGGNGNYTFIHDENFTHSNEIDGLNAETHFFAINDAKGCSDSISFTLSEPEPIIASITDIVNSACDQANGEARVVVSGGVAGYSIDWRNSKNEFYASGSFSSSLYADNYSIKITDSNHCINEIFHIVNDDNAPELKLKSSIPVTCYNDSDGILEVEAIGGSGEYTFNWDDPLRQQANIARNLEAGNYTVSVEDERGCTAAMDLSVDSPPVLDIKNIDAIEPTCNGFSNGELLFEGSGGNGGYSFHWSTTADNIDGYAQNLSAGVYSVVIEDKKGCADSIQYVLNEPESLQIDSTYIENTSCYGDCDGSVSVFPVGGTGNYQFAWENSSDQSQKYQGLCAGDYSVKITDDNNCEISGIFQVISPEILEVEVDEIINALCSYSSDGSISVNTKGGTSPYNYQWGNFPDNSTSVLSQLPSGNYDVSVIDAHGCRDSLPLSLSAPDTIIISEVRNLPPLCFEDCNGELEVEAVGGTGEFTFEWNNGGTTSYATGLCSNVYEVTAKDKNNCISHLSIYLDQPEQLHLDVKSHDDVTCYGGNDGEIIVTASGGVGDYKFLYKDVTMPGSIMSDLVSGNHQIKTEDNNGCQDSITFFIGQPEPIITTLADLIEPTCNENCDGELKVRASGGNEDFTYEWVGIQPQYSETATDLCEGEYKVIVTDARLCKMDTSFYLTAPGPLQVDVLKEIEPDCSDDCTGEIALLAYGGTYPYNFNWINQEDITTGYATNLCADLYTIEVTDFNDCSISQRVILDGPDVIQITIVDSQMPSCAESSDGTLEVAALGGTAPYKIEWISDGKIGARIEAISAGLYPVKITDAAGCVFINEIQLNAPQPLDITLISKKAPTCSYSCDGYAEVIPEGGTSPYTFQWNDPHVQTTAKATGLCPGKYEVTVTDRNGCSQILEVEIEDTPPIIVDLGDSRTLCKDQYATLDPGISGMDYSWTSTNGFTSKEQRIEVDKAGLYFMEGTSPLGCVVRDTFEVLVSEESFEVNFLAASELLAGDTLLLTEVCYPMADYLEWTFDDEALIVDANEFQPQITFNSEGVYPVTLTAYRGECYETITKQITFYDPDDAPDINGKIYLGENGFKDIKIHPNPTDGHINVHVTMHQPAPLAAFIYDNHGKEVYRSVNKPAAFFRLEFNITEERNGIYHLKLISNNHVENMKIMKSR